MSETESSDEFRHSPAGFSLARTCLPTAARGPVRIKAVRGKEARAAGEPSTPVAVALPPAPALAPTAGDRQRGPRPRRDRERLSWPCILYWEGGSAAVSLRNISADGAMVMASTRLPKGTEIVLAFSAAGTVFGTVKWTRAGRLGMRFDRPFDPGRLLKPRKASADGAPRPGIVKPDYLESELDADSPWAARWEKLRLEDLK